MNAVKLYVNLCVKRSIEHAVSLPPQRGCDPRLPIRNISMSLDRAVAFAASSMIRGVTSPDRDREAKKWTAETALFWPDPRIGSLRAGAQNALGAGPILNSATAG